MKLEGLDEFILQQEYEEKLKAQNILSQIQIRQERKNNKLKLIEELNYEKDLITNDIVGIIQRDLDCSQYNLFKGFGADVFWKVWKFSCYQDTLTKKDKEEFKFLYEYILSVIKEKILLNNNDFELTKITDSCFARHYVFEYLYKNQQIHIYIPMFSHTDSDNYPEMLEGYKIYHVQKYHYNTIAYGLDYDKVANDLKEWIEKNKEENNNG